MADAPEKGREKVQEAFEVFNDELGYFLSLNRKFLQTQSINEEIQRTLFYLQRLERIARTHGDTELSREIGETMKRHFETYNAI
jgi:hypothetical protein